MGIEIVLKIAGIGMLVAVSCQLLKQTGRDDIAMLAALMGLVIVLGMVLGEIGSLFEEVKRIFGWPFAVPCCCVPISRKWGYSLALPHALCC